jgi:hypothetical protein
MDKEIKVKFMDDLFLDLIGVVTITDGIKKGLKDLIKISREYDEETDCEIYSSLSIFTKPHLILDEEINPEDLTRDHSGNIPDAVSCEFNLHKGGETGYFCFRIYDCVDEESDYEVIEVDSEPVNVKDILEL